MPRAKSILILVLLAIFCLGLTAEAWARAGGGKSMGSSGSRNFSTSRPSGPSGGANTYQQQRPQQPGPDQFQQPSPGLTGGGFLRGLAGGMLGGFVGSMLFRGLAGASPTGEGTEGGGMGLLDFVLIGLLLYLAYRFFMRRRQAQTIPAAGQSQYQAEPLGGQTGAGYPPPPPPPPPSGAWGGADPAADLEQGLGHIRALDPGFDPRSFVEQAGDIFFQIQGAWTRRDLTSVGHLLTPEMRGLLQTEADKLKAAGQINRLENIAVRSIDLHQAWQEAGQDYLAVHLLASLLDYTVDEREGQVLSGSDRDPVKFEEIWTFTRPVGPGPWRLSAITQIN
ncbi:MAG: Tim44 domain-containing protein [Desulfarculus sp.]|nr:Tim44 domain-containing protein [Desulfarculus sp.]